MTTIAFRDVETFTPVRQRELVETRAVVAQVQTQLLPATRVHPIAIEVSILAYAWLGVACWLAFSGGETSLILSMILVLCIVYVGLLVGGAALGRDMTPERRQERTIREFLQGRVDIATGHVTGREAMMQIALLPIALAVGGTAIVLCAVWAGI